MFLLLFSWVRINNTHAPWFIHTAVSVFVRTSHCDLHTPPPATTPAPLPRLPPCSSSASPSFFALHSLTPESHTLLPLATLLRRAARDQLHTSTRVSLSAAGNNGNGAALCRTETDALLCVCLGLSADRLIYSGPHYQALTQWAAAADGAPLYFCARFSWWVCFVFNVHFTPIIMRFMWAG